MEEKKLVMVFKNTLGNSFSITVEDPKENLEEQEIIDAMNLIKTKNIIEQSKLNKEDRQHNIQGVYTLKNGSILTNKSILLIDDIYTTGSTVNECSRVLQQAKPNKIGVLVLAKD